MPCQIIGRAKNAILIDRHGVMIRSQNLRIMNLNLETKGNSVNSGTCYVEDKNA